MMMMANSKWFIVLPLVVNIIVSSANANPYYGGDDYMPMPKYKPPPPPPPPPPPKVQTINAMKIDGSVDIEVEEGPPAPKKDPYERAHVVQIDAKQEEEKKEEPPAPPPAPKPAVMYKMPMPEMYGTSYGGYVGPSGYKPAAPAPMPMPEYEPAPAPPAPPAAAEYKPPQPSQYASTVAQRVTYMPEVVETRYVDVTRSENPMPDPRYYEESPPSSDSQMYYAEMSGSREGPNRHRITYIEHHGPEEEKSYVMRPADSYFEQPSHRGEESAPPSKPRRARRRPKMPMEPSVPEPGARRPRRAKNPSVARHRSGATIINIPMASTQMETFALPETIHRRMARSVPPVNYVSGKDLTETKQDAVDLSAITRIRPAEIFTPILVTDEIDDGDNEEARFETYHHDDNVMENVVSKTIKTEINNNTTTTTQPESFLQYVQALPVTPVVDRHPYQQESIPEAKKSFQFVLPPNRHYFILPEEYLLYQSTDFSSLTNSNIASIFNVSVD